MCLFNLPALLLDVNYMNLSHRNKTLLRYYHHITTPLRAAPCQPHPFLPTTITMSDLRGVYSQDVVVIFVIFARNLDGVHYDNMGNHNYLQTITLSSFEMFSTVSCFLVVSYNLAILLYEKFVPNFCVY